MNKKTLALVPVLALVLMGASKCNLDGGGTSESCNIVARDTTSITVDCVDSHGEVTRKGDKMTGIYSDVYPFCQVGTYWPGCKDAK